MIDVEELTRRYGARTAVKDVSFRVREGEIVGFLGPNGAGKSTTLRMITGFLAPTAGRVRIAGIDALERPEEAKARIGYMPEAVPLYPEMRVHEHLRFRAELKGVPSKRILGAIEQSLGLAGISDVANRLVGQLSKGYRQRVGLADALVADPPLLILDEPTAGLDPNQIRQVRDLIRGFAGKKTVFLSTHILPEVEATCGRVVIIHKGRVVGEGAPSTLRGGAEPGQMVTVVARGEAAKARTAVGAVEGVREIADESAPSDGVVKLRARAVDGPDVLERIFAACAEAGLVLRELSREAERLEDVFASLTTEDAAQEAAGEGEGEGEGERSGTGTGTGTGTGAETGTDTDTDEEEEEEDAGPSGSRDGGAGS